MKVGLFFGSFNPIHVGHLVIANYMYAFTNLEQVWFIVSPQNPLKKKETLLNAYDRLHLVRLAIDEDPHLRVSEIEFGLSRPNYTIDTLICLKAKYPEHDFTLIMGGDSFESIEKWKNYEDILREYKIYVYNRQASTGLGFTDEENVQFYDVPLLDISASFIRESIAAGKDVRHFMPESVWRYVNEMGYYGRKG